MAAEGRWSRGDGQLTAVGGLVAAVHTVIVPVTDPDAGDAALGDGALELVGGAGHLSCEMEQRMRTLPFISSQVWSLSSPSPESLALVSVRGKEWIIPSLDLQTVHNKHSVFMSKAGDSQCDLCPCLTELELTQPLREAVGNNGVCQLPPPSFPNPARTTIPFILAVSAVVLPVATEDARNTAVGVGALELAGQADVNVWGREKEKRELRAGRGLHVPCRGQVDCHPKPRNVG